MLKIIGNIVEIRYPSRTNTNQWRHTHLDQVEGEGQVDKIADLGFWIFFSSYVCKLRGKAIFFT